VRSIDAPQALETSLPLQVTKMADLKLDVSGPGGERIVIPAGLLIDNVFVPSVEGATLQVQNAHSGATVGAIASATQNDVNAAVKSSSQAYETVWKFSTGATRRQLLNKLADLIERDLQLFATLEAIDIGQLFSTNIGALGPMAVEWLRYFAGWADKLDGRSANWDAGSERQGLSYTIREPYGVTAAIVPWNTPL
jgi:aldehyde dehydrogenase (NAD+)